MGQANVGNIRILCFKALAVTGKRNWNQLTAMSSGIMFGWF